MVGTIQFNLGPPDGRTADAEAITDVGLPPEIEQDLEADAAGTAAPRRLPFAPNPNSYTQPGTSQSTTTTAKEIRDDMESYLKAYTSTNPDYPALQTSILNLSKRL
jgi:hypothetical protein